MAEKRIKLEAVSRELSLAGMGLTGDAFRKFHADLARKELDRVLRDNGTTTGAKPYYQQFVDGRQGAPLDSVKLGGIIEFTFDYIAEIATAALELLKQLSPVDRSPDAKPPVFRDNHAIFINGSEVADLSGLKPGDEVLFANLLPYARKLEAGSSVQAPNGVYEVAQKTLRQRYGNMIYIEMTYRGFVDSAFQDPSSSPMSRERGQKRFNRSDVRYPVLILHPYSREDIAHGRRLESHRAPRAN